MDDAPVVRCMAATFERGVDCARDHAHLTADRYLNLSQRAVMLRLRFAPALERCASSRLAGGLVLLLRRAASTNEAVRPANDAIIHRRGGGRGDSRPARQPPRQYAPARVPSGEPSSNVPKRGSTEKEIIRDLQELTKPDDILQHFEANRSEYDFVASSTALSLVEKTNTAMSPWKRQPVQREQFESLVNHCTEQLGGAIDKLASITAAAAERKEAAALPVWKQPKKGSAVARTDGRTRSDSLDASDSSSGVSQHYLRSLVSTSFSLAKLDRLPPVMLDNLSVALTPHAGSLSESDAAQLITVYKWLAIPAPRLFSALQREAVLPRIDRFSPENVCTVMEGFSRVGVAAPELFREANRTLLERRGELSSRVVATALGSSVRAVETANNLPTTLVDSQAMQLEHAACAVQLAHGMATTVTDLASARRFEPKDPRRYTPQGIALTLWSYAQTFTMHPAQKVNNYTLALVQGMIAAGGPATAAAGGGAAGSAAAAAVPTLNAFDVLDVYGLHQHLLDQQAAASSAASAPPPAKPAPPAPGAAATTVHVGDAGAPSTLDELTTLRVVSSLTDAFCARQSLRTAYPSHCATALNALATVRVETQRRVAALLQWISATHQVEATLATVAADPLNEAVQTLTLTLRAAEEAHATAKGDAAAAQRLHTGIAQRMVAGASDGALAGAGVSSMLAPSSAPYEKLDAATAAWYVSRRLKPLRASLVARLTAIVELDASVHYVESFHRIGDACIRLLDPAASGADMAAFVDGVRSGEVAGKLLASPAALEADAAAAAAAAKTAASTAAANALAKASSGKRGDLAAKPLASALVTSTPGAATATVLTKLEHALETVETSTDRLKRARARESVPRLAAVAAGMDELEDDLAAVKALHAAMYSGGGGEEAVLDGAVAGAAGKRAGRAGGAAAERSGASAAPSDAAAETTAAAEEEDVDDFSPPSYYARNALIKGKGQRTRYDPLLFERAKAVVQPFSLHDVTEVVSAFASVGIPHAELFKKLAHRIESVEAPIHAEFVRSVLVDRGLEVPPALQPSAGGGAVTGDDGAPFVPLSAAGRTQDTLRNLRPVDTAELALSFAVMAPRPEAKRVLARVAQAALREDTLYREGIALDLTEEAGAASDDEDMVVLQKQTRAAAAARDAATSVPASPAAPAVPVDALSLEHLIDDRTIARLVGVAAKPAKGAEADEGAPAASASTSAAAVARPALPTSPLPGGAAAAGALPDRTTWIGADGRPVASDPAARTGKAATSGGVGATVAYDDEPTFANMTYGSNAPAPRLERPPKRLPGRDIGDGLLVAGDAAATEAAGGRMAPTLATATGAPLAKAQISTGSNAPWVLRLLYNSDLQHLNKIVTAFAVVFPPAHPIRRSQLDAIYARKGDVSALQSAMNRHDLVVTCGQIKGAKATVATGGGSVPSAAPSSAEEQDAATAQLLATATERARTALAMEGYESVLRAMPHAWTLPGGVWFNATETPIFGELPALPRPCARVEPSLLSTVNANLKALSVSSAAYKTSGFSEWAQDPVAWLSKTFAPADAVPSLAASTAAAKKDAASASATGPAADPAITAFLRKGLQVVVKRLDRYKSSDDVNDLLLLTASRQYSGGNIISDETFPPLADGFAGRAAVSVCKRNALKPLRLQPLSQHLRVQAALAHVYEVTQQPLMGPRFGRGMQPNKRLWNAALWQMDRGVLAGGDFMASWQGADIVRGYRVFAATGIMAALVASDLLRAKDPWSISRVQEVLAVRSDAHALRAMIHSAATSAAPEKLGKLDAAATVNACLAYALLAPEACRALLPDSAPAATLPSLRFAAAALADVAATAEALMQRAAVQHAGVTNARADATSVPAAAAAVAGTSPSAAVSPRPPSRDTRRDSSSWPTRSGSPSRGPRVQRRDGAAPVRSGVAPVSARVVSIARTAVAPVSS